MTGQHTNDADEPPLVWPSGLRRPPGCGPIVYLDLNHWISLAKAAVGHSQGDAFKECLATCQSAVDSGRAIVVLAAAHYSEILKVGSPRQRRDLADVMESLTKFRTVVSRVTIMKLELEAALDFVLGLESRDGEVDLVGWGVRHAFGVRSGFSIRDRTTGEDVTSMVREQYGAAKCDAYMANAMLEFERSPLRGPDGEAELQKLESAGYAPQKALQVAKDRADEELAQSRRLDGGGPWRRDRLPDVISARELLIEFQDMAPAAFRERGIGFERILTSPEAGVAFMRSMPSTDVSMALKTAWHRNRDKPWSANDIYDIDAMALAVPSCDIVVTEKACHHALISAGMDTRMDIRPVAGQSFTRDDVIAKTRVALLREEVWRIRFGGAVDIIGRRFPSRLGPVESRGVLPAGFVVPSINWASSRDGLVLTFDTLDTAAPNSGIPSIFARLRPGASIAVVQQQFDAVIASAEANVPTEKRSTVIVKPIRQGLFWNYGIPLALLFGGGSLVWLIACANLGTLMVARGRSREHETAIRRALGASTGRILGSALLESLILSSAAAGLALLVLEATMRALTSIIPAILKPLVLTSIDRRVLVFSLLSGLLGSALAALFPMWRALRTDPQEALQASATRHVARLRGSRGLLVAESAIGAVLVLAGFFAVRSFVDLVRTDLGYRPEGLFTVSIGVGSAGQSPEAYFALSRRALETLRAQPEVDGATGVDVRIGSGEMIDPVVDAQGRRVMPRRIIEDYFRVMGTRFLSGRMFTDAEIRAEAPVAILSRSAVELLLPDVPVERAIGRTIVLRNEPVRQIVGVVADTRERHGSGLQPEFFAPASASSPRALLFLARAKPGIALDEASMRTVMRREYGQATGVGITAISGGLDRWLENPRLYGQLFGAFALVGLLLSVVGLFAVTSFDASIRRYEIGVRMTLGASRREIERLIVKDAVRPVVLGIALGSLGAYWAAQFFQSLLYQVDARDLSSYAIVAAALVSAAVVAAWRPARGAGRIDPAVVLRGQ